MTCVGCQVMGGGGVPGWAGRPRFRPGGPGWSRDGRVCRDDDDQPQGDLVDRSMTVQMMMIQIRLLIKVRPDEPVAHGIARMTDPVDWSDPRGDKKTAKNRRAAAAPMCPDGR